MKNYLLFIVSIWCLSSACKNREQTQQPVPEEKQANKDFFPVADYIKGEIAYVDSLPLRLMKYEFKNGKTDSGFLKPGDFDHLAQEFLPPDLVDTSKFEKEFSESSFMDQTTQALTFTYSTKNDKLELQRVDVLANRTQGFDKVRSIYMEKNITKNDTAISKKMYWRSKKSFEIVTLVSPSNQPQVTNRLKVVWDDSE